MNLIFLILPFAFAATEIAKDMEIAAGKAHEACVELDVPQKMSYSFTSSADLVFGLHYHAEEGVQYPDPEKPRKSAKGQFEPAEKNHYCLMWTNSSKKPVKLNYKYSVK
jgi:hypothetical protein